MDNDRKLPCRCGVGEVSDLLSVTGRDGWFTVRKMMTGYDNESGQTSYLYYDGDEHEIIAVFEQDGVRIQLGDLEGVTVLLVCGSRIEKKEGIQGGCTFLR